MSDPAAAACTNAGHLLVIETARAISPTRYAYERGLHEGYHNGLIESGEREGALLAALRWALSDIEDRSVYVSNVERGYWPTPDHECGYSGDGGSCAYHDKWVDAVMAIEGRVTLSESPAPHPQPVAEVEALSRLTPPQPEEGSNVE